MGPNPLFHSNAGSRSPRAWGGESFKKGMRAQALWNTRYLRKERVGIMRVRHEKVYDAGAAGVVADMADLQLGVRKVIGI